MSGMMGGGGGQISMGASAHNSSWGASSYMRQPPQPQQQQHPGGGSGLGISPNVRGMQTDGSFDWRSPGRPLSFNRQQATRLGSFMHGGSPRLPEGAGVGVGVNNAATSGSSPALKRMHTDNEMGDAAPALKYARIAEGERASSSSGGGGAFVRIVASIAREKKKKRSPGGWSPGWWLLAHALTLFKLLFPLPPLPPSRPFSFPALQLQRARRCLRKRAVFCLAWAATRAGGVLLQEARHLAPSRPCST